MNCCRYQCGYVALIIAILAGVALGILYALGFVVAATLFLGCLAVGVIGIFLSPIYAAGCCGGTERCFASHRRLLQVAAVGTVVAAAVGLIVGAAASTVVVSILVAVATFFAVLLLGALVCLTICLSRD